MEHKMMIFNWHLLLPTMTIFLPKNKTFEGICLALWGKFRQKELRFLSVLKPFYKKTIKFCFKLIYEQFR